MSSVAGPKVIRAVQVVIGVDTHQDKHVAVAIDQQGVRLAEHHAPATSYGYGELERWSRDLGEVRAFGVEGTGSYGAGLARFLTGRGFSVVEVNGGRGNLRAHRSPHEPHVLAHLRVFPALTVRHRDTGTVMASTVGAGLPTTAAVRAESLPVGLALPPDASCPLGGNR